VIDEAASSPNQKEETFAVLMQLLPFLVKAGVAPPPSILDYLPLPSSFAADWKKQLSPDNKQPDPMQQIAIAKEQKEVEKLDTEAKLNVVRAQKESIEAEAQALENQAVKAGLIHPADL